MYMQMQTAKAEKAEEIRQKMIATVRDLQPWMTRNGVPSTLQEVIIKNIKQKLEEDKDANLENLENLENLFAVFSWDIKKALKRHLCLDNLKEVYCSTSPSLSQHRHLFIFTYPLLM